MARIGQQIGDRSLSARSGYLDRGCAGGVPMLDGRHSSHPIMLIPVERRARWSGTPGPLGNLQDKSVAAKVGTLATMRQPGSGGLLRAARQEYRTIAPGAAKSVHVT